MKIKSPTGCHEEMPLIRPVLEDPGTSSGEELEHQDLLLALLRAAIQKERDSQRHLGFVFSSKQSLYP